MDAERRVHRTYGLTGFAGVYPQRLARFYLFWGKIKHVLIIPFLN
jgi:hypothetical protein